MLSSSHANNVVCPLSASHSCTSLSHLRCNKPASLKRSCFVQLTVGVATFHNVKNALCSQPSSPHQGNSDQNGLCGRACGIHPSVHARGCRERAGYLIRSPAYPLYVKPLHCSTASGISAGTALFLSATLTIDRLNLGQIPPVRRASHSHMHSPRCRMLRSRERRAADTPPPPPPPSKFSWRLSLPHMNIPPPLHEWASC